MVRKVDTTKVFSIAKAAEYLEIAPATLRAAVKKGLVATVEAQVPGSERTVTVIEQATLDEYKAQGLTKTRNGAKAWLVRLTKEQHDEIETLLAERGIALEQRSTYDPLRARAYRLARKADAAAELDDGDIEEDWTDEPATEGEDTSDDLSASNATEGGTVQASDSGELQDA